MLYDNTKTVPLLGQSDLPGQSCCGSRPRLPWIPGCAAPGKSEAEVIAGRGEEGREPDKEHAGTFCQLHNENKLF